MIRRMISGWTVMRPLYLVIGLIIAVQSAMLREWFGLAIGLYFAAMGLFAFGCAGGSCSTDWRREKETAASNSELER